MNAFVFLFFLGLLSSAVGKPQPIAEKSQPIQEKSQAIQEKSQAIQEKSQVIAEKPQPIAENHALDKSQPIQEKSQAIAGEYIVRLRDNISEQAYEEHINSLKSKGCRILFEYKNVRPMRAYAMRLPDDSKSFLAIFRLLGDNNVVHSMESNQVYQGASRHRPEFHLPTPRPTTTATTATTTRAKTSQPPLRVESTAACEVQQEATWNLVRTSEQNLHIDGLYSLSNTYRGQNVVVYLIDTGVMMDHIEFEGRISWGFDAVDDPSPMTDIHGHGTHVAGVVLSSRHGVSRNATGIVVRVLNRESFGSAGTLLAGIDWTVGNVNQSIQMNWTLPVPMALMAVNGPYSQIMNDMIQVATEQYNIPFVVAAGDTNSDACIFSPASAPTVITATCSDYQDNFCTNANYGNCTSLIAPGAAIQSTYIGSPYSLNVLSGTSASAAHVAGMLANLMSLFPYQVPTSLASLILGSASVNKISGIPDAWTPNLLLYQQCPLTP